MYLAKDVFELYGEGVGCVGPKKFYILKVSVAQTLKTLEAFSNQFTTCSFRIGNTLLKVKATAEFKTWALSA